MARWVFRCPECRTRRQDQKLFTQHLAKSGHQVCKCRGYHHHHRKGSRFCWGNPVADLFLADREGAGAEDLLQIAARLVAERPELANKVQEACQALRVDFQQQKE